MDVIEAIKKRAEGAVTREVVEEYAVVDGEERLLRKKVTVKQSPPDMAAAKLLLSLEKPQPLSSEQLEAEKRRLLEELRIAENRED